MTTTYTGWTKSSYSTGDGPNCVETRRGLDSGTVVEVGIADSKDPSRSTVITVSPAAWTGFLTSVTS